MSAPPPAGRSVRRASWIAPALVLIALARWARAGEGTTDCLPAEPLAGPGVVDPFRPPAAAATALNAAAKILYRQGKWDDARAKYHAAELADAEFLAPTLNIACSFVRQERFDQATAEVVKLLDRAYVPWAREILTAADLGALKVQPQMTRVQQAMAADARRWGADLPDALLFIARQRAPLKLPPAPSAAPAGPVVLVLGLHQEVFAWSPSTGRYRQVTAEDGRVLAMAQSLDRQGLLYLTGEKLIRTPGAGPALRDVVIHTLALTSMSLGPAIPIEGDVRRVDVVPNGAGFWLSIEAIRKTGASKASFSLATGEDRLLPARPIGGHHEPIVLTAAGVGAADPRPLPGACHLTARDKQHRDEPPTIDIQAAGRKPLALRSRFGAGLSGLPIP